LIHHVSILPAGESDSDDTESDYSEELSASESEDHSDSDSDDSSDDEQGKRKLGRFERTSDDSDSDDDTVRVVRSAKDKRFEEIEQAVTTMANGQKINDWVSVQNGKDQKENENKADGASGLITRGLRTQDVGDVCAG